jgi:hypothetical protein
LALSEPDFIALKIAVALLGRRSTPPGTKLDRAAFERNKLIAALELTLNPASSIMKLVLLI